MPGKEGTDCKIHKQRSVVNGWYRTQHCTLLIETIEVLTLLNNIASIVQKRGYRALSSDLTQFSMQSVVLSIMMYFLCQVCCSVHHLENVHVEEVWFGKVE
jgi:hypothetical protein